ncbi:uncharacterized protein LOC123308615 [Coccinella septempunctata]|uniref:uncharacterized protein LOC123308615 n=1 Tax=Coccinella septempunctata TaxID=41139 RepID=UPI001D093FB1|nr:uncharacterized protein LOC123308615 [Coccinella septempunctata]
MCIDKFQQEKCRMINRSTLGRALRRLLNHARVENRLVSGLMPALNYMQKNTEDVLFCLMPHASSGDAATHMQTVLLQAYCYENCIPVIEVDSGQKLVELCGTSKTNIKSNFPCVIITKYRDRSDGSSDDSSSSTLSPIEQTLTDFYECTIQEFPRPIIELPG